MTMPLALAHTMLLSLIALLTFAVPPAAADTITHGALKISQPWSRVAPPGFRVAGGFLSITNTGTEPDRLIGGSFPLAGRFEIHEMAMQGGMMKMSELKDGLEIRPGQTVELRPGSYHVMFMEMTGPLVENARHKGTLVFQKAGPVEVEYVIRPLGAMSIDGKPVVGQSMPGHGAGAHGKSKP
jgi:periplasmic copper chaperone A